MRKYILVSKCAERFEADRYGLPSFVIRETFPSIHYTIDQKYSKDSHGTLLRRTVASFTSLLSWIIDRLIFICHCRLR